MNAINYKLDELMKMTTKEIATTVIYDHMNAKVPSTRLSLLYYIKDTESNIIRLRRESVDATTIEHTIDQIRANEPTLMCFSVEPDAEKLNERWGAIYRGRMLKNG